MEEGTYFFRVTSSNPNKEKSGLIPLSQLHSSHLSKTTISLLKEEDIISEWENSFLVSDIISYCYDDIISEIASDIFDAMPRGVLESEEEIKNLLLKKEYRISEWESWIHWDGVYCSMMDFDPEEQSWEEFCQEAEETCIRECGIDPDDFRLWFVEETQTDDFFEPKDDGEVVKSSKWKLVTL